MAKVSLAKGTTSYLARIFIQDSSSTTGAGLTGLTSGSSGLVCYRARDDDGNAAGTQITLSGGTRGTWSSGGFVEKDATNMKGIYELGIPDNALATGSKTVTIMLSGATNMAPCVLEIELTGTNNQDATRGGMTALPNANAAAAGGLWILGANAAATTTLTGVAASGATPATPALAFAGGAASTTGGGTAASAVTYTGGAGAASTNGAAAGAAYSGGGTNTVSSVADGVVFTATSNGHGLHCVGSGSGHGGNFFAGATGNGISSTGGATSGSGIVGQGNGGGSGSGIIGQGTGNQNGIYGLGQGTGDGFAGTGGATGRGMHLIGGATSGAGFRAEATAGNSNGAEMVHQGSGQDLLAVYAAANFGSASLNGKGDWLLASSAPTNFGLLAIDGSGDVTFNNTSIATVTTVTTTTNLTNLPSIPSNWLTAAGIAASALNGKGDWLTSPVNFAIKKNSALNNFEFLMTDSTNHAPLTGATVTAQRSIDGAAFAGCANSVTELSNGIYKINLAASDLNGTVITLRFSATGADDTFVTIPTQS
jgi:hypothetical protein